MDLQQQIKDLAPTKEFFIGIDSDGCVFDSMEPKQKEFFCPNVLRYFELLPVSKIARETWEFVNLYSKTRGINRFQALDRFFDLIAERSQVKDNGMAIYNTAPLKEWLANETKLGNPALVEYAAEAKIPEIDQLLKWSLQVNVEIGEWVEGLKPFSYVEKCLKKMDENSDALVVSQTPVEALEREWKENNIEGYVRVICGQEYGTKTEHLKYAAVGKYPADKILMIGDAPGDLKAAKANGVLFFPINPGHEEASWECLYNEALDKFYKGEYAGDYEESLIKKFDSYLPETPSW
jgi:phosphoglycolate phosphatase-like HAD superfamily hydrolase